MRGFSTDFPTPEMPSTATPCGPWAIRPALSRARLHHRGRRRSFRVALHTRSGNGPRRWRKTELRSSSSASLTRRPSYEPRRARTAPLRRSASRTRYVANHRLQVRRFRRLGFASTVGVVMCRARGTPIAAATVKERKTPQGITVPDPQVGVSHEGDREWSSALAPDARPAHFGGSTVTPIVQAVRSWA